MVSTEKGRGSLAHLYRGSEGSGEPVHSRSSSRAVNEGQGLERAAVLLSSKFLQTFSRAFADAFGSPFGLYINA